MDANCNGVTNTIVLSAILTLLSNAAFTLAAVRDVILDATNALTIFAYGANIVDVSVADNLLLT